MNNKGLLEKLIQDSYQIIDENDQQIVFADPNKEWFTIELNNFKDNYCKLPC